MNIVYVSFDGRYSDSPRAVYEEVLRRGIPAEQVWAVHPDHAGGFPQGVRTVRAGTSELVEALESADLVVSNSKIPVPWTKPPGCVYVQTWHGTPLKRIHYDIKWAPEGKVGYLHEDVERWDHLLSPNSASTDVLVRAFGFTGAVHETGLPRNDVLVSSDRDASRSRVRKDLGIADGVKVVLYAPTWRDDHFYDDAGEDFPLHLDLESFRERLGGDHVLLLRLHYMVSSRLGPVAGRGVLDVSMHPEVSDLYLAADVLVTDYSSTMFDFAVTGKPIVLFTYDLERYRDELRGFYFDLAEVAPGPMVETSEDLLGVLASIDGVPEEYEERYRAFQERFCHLEDGGAASRFVDTFVVPPMEASTGGDRGVLTATGQAPLPQVVILAAGMGTRLGRPVPKPLTLLRDGSSILGRQLTSLRSALGDSVPVTLVVGFMAETVMRSVPSVGFVHNPEYATTNTARSLLSALRSVPSGGVLWLNGDVVFDPDLLAMLRPHLEADESFVCVDTSVTAEEEVKYTLDSDGFVAELSKTVVGGLGEAIGINYVSSVDREALVAHLEECAPQDYFERGIETAIAAEGVRFRPVDVSAFPAVEVDVEEDLQRANLTVLTSAASCLVEQGSVPGDDLLGAPLGEASSSSVTGLAWASTMRRLGRSSLTAAWASLVDGARLGSAHSVWARLNGALRERSRGTHLETPGGAEPSQATRLQGALDAVPREALPIESP